MKEINLLVVEDDSLIRQGLMSKLQKYGKVSGSPTMALARDIMASKKIDIAFIDLNLETPLAGLALIGEAKSKNIYCVVLSGNDDEEVILKAYESGCDDYYVKGRNQNVEEIVEKFLMVNDDSGFEDFFKNEFITQDQDTISQLKVLKEIRYSKEPVLLLGPTGTGKTVIARQIHTLSKCTGDFVDINCSAIPENLLESELFGHVKGAFTGAVQNKDGLLMKADKGVLFLDEIGALPLALQAKLLKALEEKTFTPVGATKPVTSDFRIVSATCEDLEAYQNEGTFRRDLFFRISGINLTLRALRERKGDVIYIVNHFLKNSTRKIVLSPEVKAKLMEYHWPGNIRELKNTVNAFLSKNKGVITLQDLPEVMTSQNSQMKGTLLTKEIKEMALQVGLYETIEMLKNEIMRSVSEDNQGKVNKTISALKISNNTYYKLTK